MSQVKMEINWGGKRPLMLLILVVVSFVSLRGGTAVYAELAQDFTYFGDEAVITYSTAWGDIDGDGDLDLAVGNRDALNEIYENIGGQLSEDPILEFGFESTSPSVAWGDMDGDGDLDLAVGNGSDVNQVFENVGGVLNSTAVWESTGDIKTTSSVAWGDWDGDGDLDLAVGNNDAVNQVYENNNGMLGSTPAWESSDVKKTWSVAWGDWDNDGDLDLAVGNRWYADGVNQVFENNDGDLGVSPAWESTGNLNDTYSVAWGDWDDDGDLDLAAGNFGQPNKVYENIGDTLQTSPVWSVGDITQTTFSVVWGDWDNDGDLDLGVGNWGEPNEVYENIGGTLGTTTAWETTGYELRTFDSAWSDWDGDGDLDLTFGNWEANQIYENAGIPLDQTAVWESTGNTQDTRSLAWGDMDGDGDLDLAVGNAGAVNQVFENINGVMSITPAWESTGDVKDTQSIAWGDWDDDGDLDLAIGNSGAVNQVYENTGSSLGATPAWESTGDSKDTYSVAWADWDRDGDLDLAVGNVGAVNQIFANSGTTLGSSPAWESTDSKDSYSVAWADWDQDSDLDLAVGNNGDVNQLFENEGGVLNPVPVWESTGISRNTRAVAWGDLNGDGYLDLAVGNDSEVNEVYLNQAGILEAEPSWEAQVFSTDPWSVAWGDWDGDGDADLAAGGRVYANEAGNLKIRYVAGNAEQVVAWGDVDRDGDLDLAMGRDGGTTQLFENRQQRGENLPNNRPFVTIERPDNRDDAAFFASPHVLTQDELAVTYKLFDPESDPIGRVAVYYSWNGGGDWQEATPTNDTDTIHLATSPTGVAHTFTWDIFADAIYGQSDHVLLRVVAYPQTVLGAAGGMQYVNATPTLVQSPAVGTTTFPLRIRSTQVRVYSETVQAGNELAGAIIYRLPSDSSVGAMPLANGAGQPLQTDQAGYLNGQATLGPNDKVLALFPTVETDRYTIYQTSGAPTATGVTMHTVDSSGVQSVAVSADNTLMLFNLVVSLEWDARNDLTFMTQLGRDLERASEILYDLTNGQAAIGDIHLYHEKGFWGVADIVIQASNSQRPSAVLGGFVADLTTDEVTVGGETHTNVYIPGQIRMGPTWNRFGNPDGTLGEDWPRVLAHELGHYLFHLPDNYLGLTSDGFLDIIDCAGSAMTNPYVGSYSEFLTPTEWTGDCLDSLAEIYLGRSDWETIATFYPTFDTSGGNVGPSSLPLAVTQIEAFAPDWSTRVLADPFFSLEDSNGDAAPLPQGRSQAYLIRTRGNGDPTDDYPVALGAAVGDLVQARGAEPGDRLCVFDYSHVPLRLGCVDSIGASPETVMLAEVTDWAPQITITAVNTDTVQVEVTNVNETSLNVQLLPSLGAASNIEAMVPNGNDFSKTVVAADGAYYGYVRVWVPGSDPHKEMIVSYTAIEDWGGSAYAWGGSAYAWGGSAYAWGGSAYAWGGSAYAWGGSAYAWGAPVMSNDGQVSILPLESLFANNFNDYTLQSLDLPPTLPSWLTLTGQAYRVKTDGTLPNSVILFRYLARDVPAGEEEGLRLYYSPDEGQTWERLETKLNTVRNHASAKLQGDGIYALIATIELPSFSEGWNTFGYPVHTTRTVADALASIDGKYSSVYHYDGPSDSWSLYDATVPANFGGLVNTLSELVFAHAYWLYATEDATGYIGVDDTLVSKLAQNIQLPPATYYGRVQPSADFVPTVGMVLTAEIDGNVCGQATVQDWDGQLAYVLEVRAEVLFGVPTGCGAAGKTIVFKADGLVLDHDATWDTRQAWFHPLSQIVVPAVAPQASVGMNGNHLIVSWIHTASNSNYEVWIGTTPYFDIDDAGAEKLGDVQGTNDGEMLSFTHQDALLNTNNRYYLIRATNAGGSAGSNRVARFRFTIEPGS